MEPVEFRCPTALRQQAREQAARRGVSFSEYCRQSLIFSLAWGAAIDAVTAGAEPHALAAVERVVQHLARLTDANGS